MNHRTLLIDKRSHKASLPEHVTRRPCSGLGSLNEWAQTRKPFLNEHLASWHVPVWLCVQEDLACVWKRFSHTRTCVQPEFHWELGTVHPHTPTHTFIHKLVYLVVKTYYRKNYFCVNLPGNFFPRMSSKSPNVSTQCITYKITVTVYMTCIYIS